MKEFRKDVRGRGASSQPSNRFEKHSYQAEPQEWDAYLDEDGKPGLKTELLRDTSRTIVNENSSPDVGFTFSVNAYRGCEHGCAYCYARPTHEYLGFSPGLDFESKIMVKYDAPELLTQHLMKKSWTPATIAMSGVTDCYQPIERQLQLTRGCLEVLLRFRNPGCIITKNRLVTRDIDILSEMAKLDLIVVYVSVTTLDRELGAALEPRTSRPEARLEAIRQLSAAGVPVGVMAAPMIPGLTDRELPAILKAAAEAGATQAGVVPLRLPGAVVDIFSEWLDVHRPEAKERVLSAVRDIRGGKLNDPNFNTRMRGEGAKAEQLRQMFHLFTRKYGLNQKKVRLTTAHFARPGDQLEFF